MSFSYNLAKFIAFQDAAECARVRAIKKEDITRHPNPDFKIGVIADLGELYAAFAADIRNVTASIGSTCQPPPQSAAPAAEARKMPHTANSNSEIRVLFI